MTTRLYSSISQETTLVSAMTANQTTMVVNSASALLAGSIAPTGTQTFTVVIDPDTSIEEIVDVVYPSSSSSNTLTIVRGIATSGVGITHSPGAKIRHMATGRDFTEANTHATNNSSAHGLTISDVITTTNTKTITNKTISAADNTLTGVATLTGTQTLTNKTLTSPTINGGTVSAAAVTGLSAPSAGGDAANKTYVDSILGSATSAATSATAAANSAAAASTSATNAASSASAASGSAATATTQATNASNSATTAATSATNAANSATAAAGSATTATSQATAASGSATSAGTSATNAANSATAAANSATSAGNSATSAANSLTSVTGLTGAGVVRDMGLITDADTTTGSFISLSTLTTNAQTAATNSSNSATASASSASAASTSATAAASSASAAATSATNASNSASAASTSATNAATSATNSANSATASANSAALAATVVASAVSGTLIDAKGDLLVGTANDTVTRLPVGTNGQVLVVDSAEASGIKWAAPSAADITSVNAGTGISGGGTAGDVTITNSMATALTTKGDIIVATGSGTFVRQAVGSNGQVLAANSAQADGVEWVNNVQPSDYSAKGVILVGTAAGTYVAQTVGTNGQVLTANSAQADGVEWTTLNALPSQTGNSGKYLTTNGTAASWSTITTDPLPQIMMMMGA